MKISCEQFETLMNFYLNNELNESIKIEFEKHLQTCESCRKKYNAFKNIIMGLRESYKKFTNYAPAMNSSGNEKEKLNSKISAYIDNELDIKENIKIKKMIISKPDIRKKIEQIYQLKILLNDSFQKTTPKEDFSKNLIKKIYNTKNREINKNLILSIISFLILSVIWIIMLISAISI